MLSYLSPTHDSYSPESRECDCDAEELAHTERSIEEKRKIADEEAEAGNAAEKGPEKWEVEDASGGCGVGITYCSSTGIWTEHSWGLREYTNASDLEVYAIQKLLKLLGRLVARWYLSTDRAMFLSTLTVLVLLNTSVDFGGPWTRGGSYRWKTAYFDQELSRLEN
ncbi:hypothetical protein IFR05_008649 [Cadophora sp. M221]|nr:hypothetical protein IFR05_008649 [Cadophora sp. M221]